MTLSDYTGLSPPSNDDATVIRVAPHRLWEPGHTRTESCPDCGGELVLSEAHLVVVLEHDGRRRRRYFRDESCVRAWLGAK